MRSKNNSKLLEVIVVLFIIFLPFGYSFLSAITDKKEIKKIISQKNSDVLVTQRLKKYIQLPTNDKPKLISVKDKEKFKHYPFYDVVKNGDIVLVYQKEKLAFIYDTYSDKLVGIVDVSSAHF